MGRSPCCEKAHTNKGAWTKEEDQRLVDYINLHGEGSWRSLPKAAGLRRCGKSCRLRWINYLRPDLKRGNFTKEEDDLIIKLHALLGNKWSLIAARLAGRTDNEIKNYWNTHVKRNLINHGIDPKTHRPLTLTLNHTNNAKETIVEVEDFKFNHNNHDDAVPQQQHQHQPSLDLSIGLLPFRSDNTPSSVVNSKRDPLRVQLGLSLCCNNTTTTTTTSFDSLFVSFHS